MNKNIQMLSTNSLSPLLIKGGTPISGGTYPGVTMEDGLDGDPLTIWASSQTYTNIGGTSYLGKLFPNGEIIRKVKIITDAYYGIASAAFQTFDGATWTTRKTVPWALETLLVLDAPLVVKGARLLALSDTAASGRPWRIYDLLFYQV